MIYTIVKYAFFVVVYLLLSFVSLAGNIEYGLHIKSHPLADLAKTSLVLENGKPFQLSKETTLSFDLFIRRENAFGMICRMITDKKENIDLYIAIGDDGKHYPMLLINESIYMLPDEILYEQWVTASICLVSAENKIKVSYGTSELTVPYPISEVDNVSISFGLCPFPNYTIYDIASVNVRNIRFFNQGKPVRYWKLEQHTGEISYDSLACAPAQTKNAKWIADDYSTWVCFYSKQLKQSSLFTFNSRQEKLYILPFDQKNLVLVYDVITNRETIIEAKNSHQISSHCSGLVYDESRNRLIAYNLEEESVFVFSFDNQSWSNNGKFFPSDGKYGVCYNSAVFSPEDSLLYSFGGYGYLKFYNDLITLNVYNDTITHSILSKITPRSHPSMCKIGNQLYVFGGRGSKTGRQEISPKNYIDLYSVNLTDGKTNCLWELNDTGKAFFPGENMFYDETEKWFYTVIDENDLSLIRFNEHTPGYETVSYSTYDHVYPLAFHRNLHFSPQAEKFYAVTCRTVPAGDWLIELHVLNYPPVPVRLNEEPPAVVQPKRYEWLWIGLTLLLAVIGFLVFFRIYKRKRKRNLNTSSPLEVNSAATLLQNRTSKIANDLSGSSIRLLGEFLVTDTRGNNITNQFSSTLKNIFVLLLLHSEPDGKGVTTNELIKLFWQDKDKEAAINNKNVYFSRLRSLLNEIGHSEIVNVNTWKIRLGKDVTCDYKEALKELSNIRKMPENINALLDLLEQGSLLPEIENDWIDGFKQYFSDRVIDVLTGLSQSGSLPLDDSQKFRMANILFLHDYLSEEALFLKCSVLFYSGKKGSAQNVYSNFCKEHFNLLKTPYKYSLSDVLSKKPFY
jgi:two-component SAPR family response regulator